MRIMLVEDNESIILGLEYLLSGEGFQVISAKTMGEAQEALCRMDFDLILLDIALPDGDGFKFCRTVKRDTEIPVIFLTAREEEADVVKGLDMGADDYVIKPFRNRELVSRIRGVLRRSGKTNAILRCGDVSLDTVKGRVSRDGTEIRLTKLEYKILSSLMSHPGKIFTRDEILAGIWDISGSFVNDNTLSVTMKRLREKLVSVLNGKGNEDAGAALLEKYGVYQAYGGKTFAAQEQGLFYLRLCCNVLLVLLCLVFTVALLWYLRGRQHKISELTYYMESLNRHEYKLDLDDNGEDELSGLRNEIYKFLVMLREQADRAVERRRVLADSMEDISHQLKTPLTSITVLIDNLSEEPDMEPDVRRRFMSELTYQTAGMSWLVTTMLKTSRLDAGVVELVRERIPVKTLAEDVAQRLEIAAEWKQAVFSVDAAEDAMLYADEKWTAEALMNIVKNAIEHSPQGGRIEITGEENDIYTQIAVRDHGEGITQEEQRKLFQRFYNGGSVREDSMGIGLALAKKIVEKQNGFIAVQSRRGEGTVITLRFLKN